MNNLEIAEKLKEQIREQWPYVSTILSLHEHNSKGLFTEMIRKKVAKVLPDEVFYQMAQSTGSKNYESPWLLKYIYEYEDADLYMPSSQIIESLPINIVLFGSEDNPLGILK